MGEPPIYAFLTVKLHAYCRTPTFPTSAALLFFMSARILGNGSLTPLTTMESTGGVEEDHPQLPPLQLAV